MAEEDTSPVPTPAEEPATPPPEAAPVPATSEVPASEPVTETPSTEAQTAQPEPPTAQITVSEPLPVESEPLSTEPPPPHEATAGQSEPIPPASASAESSGATAPEPPPVAASAPVATAPITTGNSRDMFVKARSVIQVRKHEKLDKIMEALNTKDKITNDDVEKLLHVSDATATRYLSALEKDGKIKQVGKTGIGVVYTKI